MRPNSKQLAMRDPALAALMGVVALGTDFGSDYGAEFGEPDDWGAEFGDDDYGDDDLGDDDIGAIARRRPPSSQQLVRLWAAKAAMAQRGRRRTQLLDPNRGSGLKVERYVFPLSQAVTIGTASALAITGSPDCTFRPQRFTMVVPTAGFITITEIKMANVGISIGPGLIDAFQFNSNGVGQMMDMPTLTPANRATILGNYTGFLGGFSNGTVFTVSATFVGPSALAGGASI